jgi:hypothetical protein
MPKNAFKSELQKMSELSSPPITLAVLALVQAIPVKTKLTSSFLSNSSQAKSNITSLLAISVNPKQTFFIPSHSSPSKTDFLHFQVITVNLKPTSFIPSNSSWTRTDYLHSKPLQSSQNRLSPF